MARKALGQEQPKSLRELVVSCYSNNTKATDYKKKADAENKEIKKLFVADDSLLVRSDKAKKDERTIETDGIIATYYLQQRKSVDEEGMVQFLKEKGYTDAIKTIEVLDSDKLEKMAYDGSISKDDLGEMAKFEIIKDVPTLTVKLVKED